jgi:hypothetical protein
MCQNLDLRFLLFYCLFTKDFMSIFTFFLSVLLYFLLFIWFYHTSLSPFLFVLILSMFLAHVISSLAYPNLLGTKRLVCCCFDTQKS